MKNSLYLILLAALFLTACNASDRPKNRENKQAVKTETVSIPDFNADSAYTVCKATGRFRSPYSEYTGA